MPDLLAAIERRGLVIEALPPVGRPPHNEVAHAYRRAGVKATVVPYLDDIASAFRSADLLIAPSGAGVVAEAAVAGVPALYVALGDAAGDHQAANAVAAAAAGAALAVRETEWQSEALAGCVAALLADAKAWDGDVDGRPSPCRAQRGRAHRGRLRGVDARSVVAVVPPTIPRA